MTAAEQTELLWTHSQRPAGCCCKCDVSGPLQGAVGAMWLPCATSNGVPHGAGPCCCTVPYSLLMWLRPAALAVQWLPAGMLACRLRCTPHQPGPAVHLQQDHLHQHHQETRQPGLHAQYRWRPCPAQQLGREWYHRCMKALQLEAPAEHKCRRCSQLVEGVQLCMAPAPLGAIPM
jgi:hypothetical protein